MRQRHIYESCVLTRLSVRRLLAPAQALGQHGDVPLALHALPKARWRSVQGLAFDVDETFTTGGALKVAALEALYALRAAGISVVGLTGRPLGYAEVWAAQWPVSGMVAENGGAWLHVDAQGRWQRHQRGDATHEAWRERLVREALAAHPEAQLSFDHPARKVDVAFDIAEREQMQAVHVEALANWLRAQGCETTRSSIHLHAQRERHNKVTGFLDWHATAYETAPRWDSWCFVGDSLNDKEAFAGFPLAVGVANVAAVLAQLPQPPLATTERQASEGFAELARCLLEARHG